MNKILEYFKEHYGLTVLAHSGDKTWYNLNGEQGIGCVLEKEGSNITYEFYVTTRYGMFKYTKMGTHLLGAASDLAYQRTLAVAKVIPQE